MVIFISILKFSMRKGYSIKEIHREQLIKALTSSFIFQFYEDYFQMWISGHEVDELT